ncbi:DNA polymerase III subunit delta, partial [Francisella tularensis subsp. holarctica]|nr:DNA polymerase III subunit delta [Francisella tularensis subsp. holarctica]
MYLSYFELIQKNYLTDYIIFIITVYVPLQINNTIEKISYQFKTKNFVII